MRQQISVLRRTAPKRVSFSVFDRLVFAGHYRLFPNICDALAKWFGVTSHPTAEWIANQLTEACGWEQAPRYLIRDRDGAYGESSSEDVDLSVFTIDRRRHVPHGKTDVLNDLSARSDGNALTTLLCSASGIFGMCCSRT